MATVLSISSRVVRGNVGNGVAGFALRRLGHEVWDVPTVLWDRHPGLGRPSGLTLTGDQLTSLLADQREPDQMAAVGLVLSGYLASAGQIAAVAAHVLAARAAGHRPLYCCDPVCGDAPGLYVAADVLDGLRDRLVPLADIVTPNAAELGFLTGRPVATNAQIVVAARALGRPICLVTSAFGGDAASITNLLVTPQAAWTCEVPRLEVVPHGTGDLMTALFAGWIARGAEPVVALGRATAGVAAAIAATRTERGHGLDIVAAQEALADPAGVHVVRPWPVGVP